MSKRNENRQGYKRTREGWVPKDWDVCRISELGEVKAGRQRSPNHKKGNIYPYLRVANILEGRVDKSDVFRMKFTEAEFGRYRLEKGDILLNEGQSLELVGRCARYEGVPENCCYQNTLIRFRPNGCTNSDFALQLFTYLQKSGVFSKVASRTTSIAHLGSKRFGNIHVFLPPIAEQLKISVILSTWDDAIDQTRKLIEKKEQVRKALLIEILTGNRRPPVFRNHKWKRYRIKDLLEQVSRPIDFDDNKTYKLVSVRRRSEGVFFRGELRGSDILTKNLYAVREGDLLLSKMQIVHGAVALVEKEFDGFHISGSYITLRAKSPDILDISFLSWLSKTPMFYHLAYLASYGVHIEKMTFNLRLFFKSKVWIPEKIEEQKYIVKILALLDLEMHKLKKQLSIYKRQKRGLMQKLLTGKVRVKIDREEPRPQQTA